MNQNYLKKLCFAATVSVFVYIYSFLQYGTSRVHKIRYWRSISMLREKVQRFNNILPEHGRAIPLQTGLEIENGVPKPIIKKRDYNLMYYLAILIFLMFSIPCVFLSYCQMLWIRFFSAQQRMRFAGCLDLFINPASKARFSRTLTLGSAVHLASAGG
jgi:hypothetical protein